MATGLRGGPCKPPDLYRQLGSMRVHGLSPAPGRTAGILGGRSICSGGCPGVFAGPAIPHTTVSTSSMSAALRTSNGAFDHSFLSQNCARPVKRSNAASLSLYLPFDQRFLA